MSGFDLSKESFDSDFTVVADGVYMLSERHTPGGASHIFPVINNRGFIFRVKNAEGKEHLLLNGVPTDVCIAKAHKVEEATGLNITLIVGSGDFHHLALKDWLDAFSDAKVVFSGLKFPKTRNGIEILENPSYRERIELVTGPDFPSLEQYSDVVKFVGFNQFITAADPPWSSKNIHTISKDPKFKFLRQFAALKATEKFLAVWTYHVPSKQLIYEHNFNFFLTKEHFKQFGFPFSFVLPKEKICSCAKEKLPTAPKSLEECQEHCRQMAMVLDLDVRAMMEYHSLPGGMAGRYKSKEEYREALAKVLKPSGEHQADGLAMYKAMNRRCFCF
jgi:hypothetical protein